MARMTAPWLAVAFLAACGADGLEGAGGSKDFQPEIGDGGEVTFALVPSSLTCVTESTRADGEDVPHVVRVSASIAEGRADVSARREPQFWSHDGAWNGDFVSAAVEPRTVVVVPGEQLHLRERGAGGFDLVLERQGLFYVGQLADGAGAARSELAATCWSFEELFGSPWGGEPRFPARFDWAEGGCRDASGAPALNDLPIEFVRETGFAQCADLRGLTLNGDDRANPSLEFWDLSGAVLEGAQLASASMLYAMLYGARLEGLSLSSAVLHGSMDGATVLPDGVSCEVTENPWSGQEAKCTK